MKEEQIVSRGLLNALYSSEHVPAIFTGRETDDPTFRLIGQIIPYTQDADYIFRLIKSMLPTNYAGDTLMQVHDKVRRTLSKGFQERDNKQNKPPTQSTQLVETITHTGAQLFHNVQQEGIIGIPRADEGHDYYFIQSKTAELWVRKTAWEKMRKALSATAVNDMLSTLESLAFFNGEEKQTHLRIGKHDGKLIVNLANNQGEVVVIDEDSYSIIADSPIIFVNSQAMLPLPRPTAENIMEDPLSRLQDLLSLDDQTFYRILAFIICCYNPHGPYPLLLLHGEQGSGKSFLSYVLKMIVDPNNAAKQRMPGNERDLMIHAKNHHLLVYDNISGLKNDTSDMLCSLLTGITSASRKLYTDSESAIFTYCRPVITNGINSTTWRPDLLDRSLYTRLPRMAEGQRKTEAQLKQEFEELLPSLLDRIFRIISCVLKNLDKTEAPTDVRMSDAARWLVASESATRLPSGTLLSALKESQREIIIDNVIHDTLAIALVKVLENNPFDGTMGELHEKVIYYKPLYDRMFPTTSSHLSRALDRKGQDFEKAGIMIEMGPRTRKGKTIRCWLREDAEIHSQEVSTNGVRRAFHPGGIEA